MKNNNNSYGEMNDLNLKLVIALSRAYQSTKSRALKCVKEGGLTTAQFGVLEVLYHKGDLRIRDIINKTLSTGGNMTVVIDNLEKDGLVSRYPDPSDRRATLISITERGRAFITAIFPQHLEAIEDIYAVLTKEEKEILLVLLKKLSRY